MHDTMPGTQEMMFDVCLGSVAPRAAAGGARAARVANKPAAGAADRHACLGSSAVAAWGNNSGRGLHGQVGDVQEMMFDVCWGSVAPRVAAGGTRAARVANMPVAEPLTGMPA